MLRGASADALADLSEKLGKSRTLAEYATMGEDLLGVAGVLRAEPGLRRVATDASVEGAAKAGLIDNVFSKALDALSLKVVEEAVQRRWTVSHDLPDVLEQLGVIAVVRSAGAAGTGISDELFNVLRLLDDNHALRSALTDPARSTDDKGTLLAKLLDGKALPATIRLVRQALLGTHGSVNSAVAEYQRLAADVHGEIVATVRAARDLSEDERQRLAAALGKQYDASVHLHVVVNPDLVGGMRVEIGDDVIDGTVANKLDDARRRLAG